MIRAGDLAHLADRARRAGAARRRAASAPSRSRTPRGASRGERRRGSSRDRSRRAPAPAAPAARAGPSRSARSLTCSADSSPLTYSVRRPAPRRWPSTMFVSVDLPIPGEPPSSTSDPGTSPPPSTRSSSPMPVDSRVDAAARRPPERPRARASGPLGRAGCRSRRRAAARVLRRTLGPLPGRRVPRPACSRPRSPGTAVPLGGLEAALRAAVDGLRGTIPGYGRWGRRDEAGRRLSESEPPGLRSPPAVRSSSRYSDTLQLARSIALL